jgi:fucose permease
MDLQPSGLTSVLLDIAIIGGLVATIVIGLIALRNHRRR